MVIGPTPIPSTDPDHKDKPVLKSYKEQAERYNETGHVRYVDAHDRIETAHAAHLAEIQRTAPPLKKERKKMDKERKSNIYHEGFLTTEGHLGHTGRKVYSFLLRTSYYHTQNCAFRV